jgi:hypothetical protein
MNKKDIIYDNYVILGLRIKFMRIYFWNSDLGAGTQLGTDLRTHRPSGSISFSYLLAERVRLSCFIKII